MTPEEIARKLEAAEAYRQELESGIGEGIKPLEEGAESTTKLPKVLLLAGPAVLLTLSLLFLPRNLKYSLLAMSIGLGGEIALFYNKFF